MHAGAQQRGEIVRANGQRQIGPASGVLEETRGPRRKGTKEELAPPIEAPLIEMRCANVRGRWISNAIDFRVVL